jgi:hypothetical protein
MKNKSSNRNPRGSYYFFRQRIHGKDSSDNMLELVRPDSELEKSKSVLENILRWEDDGGQMLAAGNPIDWSNPDMARERAKE